jgi:two-component system response regulator HydG
LFQVLIIEDNQTMREGMVATIKKLDLSVDEAGDGVEGVALCKKKKYDLVISDYKMERMNGIEVLKQVKNMSPDTEVLIITAYGSIDLAVQAMQAGAADFITKPFSHDEFRIKIRTLLKKLEQNEKIARLKDENEYLREELDEEYNFGEIIGESPKMKTLYTTIAKVAKTNSSVIIYGESGTGKELVARAIHKSSPRAANPFIRVNCGALAEGVLESELFGHERGAFTGALRRKRGRFELANTGTIFLDEIGDLPTATQVKLLRVLQEREFERVGSEDSIKVDVRVITATNKDLEKQVQEKQFRKDLYYRLHIIPIYLPPLRERAEDIPLLAKHFIMHIGKKIGRHGLSLSDSAMRKLCTYHWPGNVRELENILERSAVLTDSEVVKSSDLALDTEEKLTVAAEVDTLDLNSTLSAVEKLAIEKALEKAKGTKTRAAKLLGIKTSALYYKLEKYGLA